MAKTKKEKGFLDGYKTYDPEIDGYGSTEQWRDAFFDRLGINRAIEVLGEDDPHTLLGVVLNASWEEIKKAYRTMAFKYHPDRNRSDGASDMMKKINAAYEVLEDKYND